jgi:HEAT repeat protein
MRYVSMMVWFVGVVLAAALAASAADDVKKLADEVSSTDKAVCLQAIDQLGTLGEDAAPAVPALVKALANPEAEIRWHAARGLGSIGAPAKSAVPALVEKLDDEVPEVRSYAAYALGKIGDGSEAIVDRLIPLAFDASPLVRRAAMRAVHELNPPQEKTMPMVLKILEESDPSIVMPALHSLAEQGEEAVPRLIRALEHDRACYWACLVLAEIGPKAKDAVPHLKPVLQHKDPEVRMQALVALGEIGPASQPLIPDMVAALKNDEIGGVRYAAAFALGRVGTTPEANAALEEAIKGKDAFLRMVGAWAIARNNPNDRAAVQRAMDLILEAFKSEDVHLRRAAARVAVDLNVPFEKIAPLLVEALRDKDPSVVGNAINALAELGPKALKNVSGALGNKELRHFAIRLIQRMGPKAESAVPALVSELQKPAESDEDVMFQREIQFALAAIGPEAAEAIPALVGSLSSDKDPIRGSAAFALGRIGPAARAAVPALRKNMTDPNPIVRLASLRALLQIQPREPRLAAVATPLLLKALDSEHELVRAEAAAALGELGGSGKPAIPRLKTLLEDDSPLVRERAADALKRLGDQQ